MLATPELITQAATDLTTIDSTLITAHLKAAGPTQGLLPPAADEVSVGITQLFSQHADDFQLAAAQASTYHDQFIRKMTAAAGAYAGAEAVNAESLWQLLGTTVSELMTDGFSAYARLWAWAATLPQPFSQIFATALTAPMYALFVPFALIFVLSVPLLFALLAYNGVSLFPPYNL